MNSGVEKGFLLKDRSINSTEIRRIVFVTPIKGWYKLFVYFTSQEVLL